MGLLNALWQQAFLGLIISYPALEHHRRCYQPLIQFNLQPSTAIATEASYSASLFSSLFLYKGNHFKVWSRNSSYWTKHS